MAAGMRRAVRTVTKDPMRSAARAEEPPVATAIADILGPLAQLLDQADVVEISVNADHKVWVERFGQEPEMWSLMNPAVTERFIRWCATWSQASILAERPILSGRIPGTAHRIEALIPPVVEAPAFSIRRHRDQVISLEDFLGPDKASAGDQASTGDMPSAVDPTRVRQEDLTLVRQEDLTLVAAQNLPESASPGVDASTSVDASGETSHLIPVGSPRRLLSEAIADQRNILIAGATGSGKTTLLNACLDHLARIEPQTRLITIEDTPEIRVPLKNTLGLRSSPDVSMDRLLVSTLRLAPDRIVVGEVREGAVLMTLIKAWDTGHPGGLTTLHANSAAEVLPRLKMLATEVMASDPTQRLMQSLDMIVFLRRGRHRPIVETIVTMRRGNLPPCLERQENLPEINRAAGSSGSLAAASGDPTVSARTMEVVYSHET